MKELTIEEKAKRYNDILGKAKKFYDANTNEGYRGIFEEIFPEFIESNDEKIRKELIEKVKETPACIGFNDKNAVLAWLEKQGEPAEINPTEFDTRLQALIGKFDSLPKEELVGSLSFWLNVVQNDGTYKDEEKQGEQNPIINVPSREVILAIWDLGNEWKELTNGSISTEHGTQLDYIQKHWHESEYYLREKQGEQKLLNNDKYQTVSVEILDRLYESEKELEQLKQREQKPANNILEAWKDMRLEVYQQASGNRHESNYSDDATKMFSLNDIDEIIEKMSEQKPAKWSEEDDYNAQCMIAKAANDIQNGNVGRNNELIDWLKSLRDRVQPKQVWSEEDEEIIECLNNCLDELEKENGWRFVYVNNKNVELNKIRNWLKSLKPQNHWKPTNEQMDALLFVVRNYTPKFITDKLAWNSLKTLELMYHELLLREEDYD